MQFLPFTVTIETFGTELNCLHLSNGRRNPRPMTELTGALIENVRSVHPKKGMCGKIIRIDSRLMPLFDEN